jgi:hypothetical protein
VTRAFHSTDDLVPEALEKLGEGREAEVFAWREDHVLRVMRKPNENLAAEL